MRLIGAIVCLLAGVCLQQAWAEPGLAVQNRVVRQVALDPYVDETPDLRQAWVIDYEFRYVGDQPIALNASDVELAMEGWLSNSRVPGNGAPRQNKTKISGSAPSAKTYLIEKYEDQCFERTSFWYSSDKKRVLLAGKETTVSEPLPLAVLNPNDLLRITVQIEHFHAHIGAYEPLLGERTLNFKIGPFQVKDRFQGEDYYRSYNPNHKFKKVDDTHLDNQFFVSGPDAYYIASHISGMCNLSLDEKTVRPSSRQKLSFYYLVASGGDTPLKVDIKQYQATEMWKPVEDETVTLETVGQWKRFEKVVKVAVNGEKMALRFYIGGELGEVWIDDVKLEPLGAAPEGP